MVTQRGKAWERTGVEVPGVRHFEGLWPFKFTTIPYLSFAEGFHIPERLLHRPWAHDKASLLYVLVSLNGEIDWKGSMAGEAAKLGIREAIKEKNEQAVAALAVLLGVPKAIDTSMLRYDRLRLRRQHSETFALQRTDPGTRNVEGFAELPGHETVGLGRCEWLKRRGAEAYVKESRCVRTRILLRRGYGLDQDRIVSLWRQQVRHKDHVGYRDTRAPYQPVSDLRAQDHKTDEEASRR
jgi:hypothetical protein